MKFYQEQTEKKLGFDQIREYLAEFASTVAGKEKCRALAPVEDPIELKTALTRVFEYLRLLDTEDGINLFYGGEVSRALSRAEIEGNWLNEEEAFGLLQWMKMVRETVSWFKQHRERAPKIWELFTEVDLPQELIRAFDDIFDRKGRIKDSASPDLRRIRREINRLASDLRKELNGILRKAIREGWTPDGEITIRNDRLVIPLKTDFKGRIPGFVHDVSQSGQTVFLEPQQTLETNNRLRRLHSEEKNEIVKILTALTAEVKIHLPALREFTQLMAEVDRISAATRLARGWDCTLPKLNLNRKHWVIKRARHPLLMKKLGRKNVVPLSFEMDLSRRIMLISGPNAGGKSVTLKTVGLLQLMLQSGLLIPVDEGSEYSLINQLFLDIGDDQSIQSDLSTYTSHLSHMKTMVENLNSESLLLIDEFGSGTDPRLGGAIAEAFLERFVKSNAYGIITTHYGNLKNYADATDGIQNAAMQFDPTNLAPTYRLIVGTPGRSYAFEIAKNVGISKAILDAARARISKQEIYTDELLLKLENQKKVLDEMTSENKAKQGQLKFLQEKYEILKSNLEAKKGEILNDAVREAEGIIKGANAKIERTIREIKEAQADKEKTRKVRKALKESLQDLPKPKPVPKKPKQAGKSKVKPAKPVKKPLKTGPLEVGDHVKLASGATGKILEINKKKVIVAVGTLKVTAKLNTLERIAAPETMKGATHGLKLRMNEISQVKTELNVMGNTVEEALPRVTRFLDDAVNSNLREVRILHGKGTGALREAIRNYIRTYPEISSFKDAPIQLGGAGWTVIRMDED